MARQQKTTLIRKIDQRRLTVLNLYFFILISNYSHQFEYPAISLLFFEEL